MRNKECWPGLSLCAKEVGGGGELCPRRVLKPRAAEVWGWAAPQPWHNHRRGDCTPPLQGPALPGLKELPHARGQECDEVSGETPALLKSLLSYVVVIFKSEH